MKNIRKVIIFYQSHLWCKLCSIFGIALLCITFYYQKYLENEYSNFLFEKNHLMESAVLDTMQKNVEYALEDYITAGAYIATSQDVYDLTEKLIYAEDSVIKDSRDLKRMLITRSSYSGNTLNMTIVSEKGILLEYDRLKRYAYSMWYESEDEEELTKIYQQLLEKANGSEVPRYLTASSPSVHPVSQERVFHIFYPIIGNNKNFSDVHAMLSITYSMNIFQPFFDIITKEEASYSSAYITDQEGIIIYHSNESYIGSRESEYLKNGNIISLDKSLFSLGWKLHIALDRSAMNQKVREIISKGILVYILLLVFLLALFAVIIGTIVRPLLKIKQNMNGVCSDNKREKLKIKGKHEIWQLAEGYNEMTDKLTQKEKEVEQNHQLALYSLERQHQAEREALETQINAHFLCNTLGMINYEAMECGNYTVSLLIKKLSNILRYTFEQKCQTVYMSQEMAWIEQYLFLQKSRLEDVFNYAVDFPDELSNWPCCKLMLQPFVENAILHGFEGREVGGILKIAAKKYKNRMVLMIKDNGCGISKEKCIKIQEILDGKKIEEDSDIGIGIQNVAARMRLFYGEDVKIRLWSHENKGTSFCFYIPMKEK